MEGRILDLNVFVQETLDIKLLDGSVIHIHKPTREQVIKIAELQYLKKTAKPEVSLDRMDSLVLDILNSNDAGIVFDHDYVDQQLNVRMRIAIITAYSVWIGEIEANPN